MTISALLPPGGPRGPAGDQLGVCLTEVRSLLDDVRDTAVWALDDARIKARLREALAVKAGVDEVVGRLVAQIDDRDLAREAGASSTQAHLVAAYRMSRGAAAETVAQARAMTPRTEITRSAWASGHISGEQAHVIGRAVARLDPRYDDGSVLLGQADLIQHAQRLPMRQLQAVANRLVEVIDPDGADEAISAQLEADEARARHEAVFRGRRGVDGVARFSGRMPNLQFDMLMKALEAIASPRRQESSGSSGRDPASRVTGAEPALDVTASREQAQRLPYGQRLGLAFCDLVEHLPTSELPRHGVANVSIVVTIDEERLRAGLGAATLDTGGPVSATEIRRLACNADILPVVLSGGSAVLELGMSRRLFDRHKRLALAVRDQGCIWPGCDRPPAWCEAHHCVEWSRGGPTDLQNGCLVCPFHHHLLHSRAGWGVAAAPDGVVEVVPPDRLDPARQPIRHERFQRQRFQQRRE